MIRWYHWTLFSVVVCIALVMSWYSMTDLTYNGFDIPWILSASVSLIFDLGGMFLGLMAIEYAKTQDSGFWPEVWTFAFIGASVYINVQHADMSGYGTVGMVVFGAAPVVAGVLLKVLLSFLTRQARRQAGRQVDRLPSVGLLTWARYSRASWTLMSVAMRKRLVDAGAKLDIPEDRHAIFAGQMDVQTATVETPQTFKELTTDRTPELVHVDSKRQDLIPVRTESDIDEIVYIGELVTIPDWLPKEPTMSLGRIAEICIENGQTDTRTILQWAKDIKHSDIKYGSMYKAVQRAKEKVQL